jgi:ribosomal protein S18 acetylase RimI-like enzyme
MATDSAAVASGLLEELMDLAWPAPEREELDGWMMRAAGGVTQRANSIWPRSVAADPAAALSAAALWYRLRWQPLIFQVYDEPRHAELNALLDAGRFTRQSETLIMARAAEGIRPGVAPGVEITAAPSEEWLHLWWSVDGRGGDAELEIARGILAGCPSQYALVRADDGVPAAVGRLALPAGARPVDAFPLDALPSDALPSDALPSDALPSDALPSDALPSGVQGGWGGLYCMATGREHRRQGFARRVLDALLSAGVDSGASNFWLMVTAGNTAAQALYAGAGFVECGRYLYRQAPLQRPLTGC